MTAGPNPTLYDVVSYPGHPYDSTHPDRLAVVGSLFGMAPAPASRCRLLELGCGFGANLVPMASQYPDSTFVGIDLSATDIEKGTRIVGDLALRNITVRHGDIAEVTRDCGEFDYIVTHGVYSWVPQAVREAMLDIFKNNLAPQGIVYVSYNARPFSHLRDLARDIMNFHVHDIADPQQRIGQARAILKFVTDASDKTTVHGIVLRAQLDRVSRMGDQVLFHDDLNESGTAFLLHQMVADAKAHGLQYLADATLARSDLAKHSDSVRQVLEGFPEDEYLARDQFLDFIEGHGFRRTLLCHDDIELKRALTPDSLDRYFLASSAQLEDPALDATASGVTEFKIESGETVATDHALTKAALLRLGQHWPAAMSFDELIAGALADVGSAIEGSGKSRSEHIGATKRGLFAVARRGHLVMYNERPAICSSISAYPEASGLARRQAQFGIVVTNLRHMGVQLEDEPVRQLLMLVDGTRDIDRLVADLTSVLAGVPMDPNAPPINRASITKHLEALSKLALLVR